MSEFVRNIEQTQNDTKISAFEEKVSSFSFTETGVYVNDRITTFYHQKSASVEDIESSKIIENKKKKWFQIPKTLKRHDSSPIIDKTGYGGLKAGTVEPPSPPSKLIMTLDNLPNDNYAELESMIDSPCLPTPPNEASDDSNLKSPVKSFLPKLKRRSQSLLPSPRHSISSFEDLHLLNCVFTEDSLQLVMDFRNIKPRSTPLRGRLCKLENSALSIWQSQLITSLKQNIFISLNFNNTLEEKQLKSLAVREFIINELFSTEITYWNQLNFTKVMHRDPFRLAIERNSPFVVESDLDGYANLEDLLRLSSTMILKLKQQSFMGDIRIGSVFRELAEYMVVFLRCALDYPFNKKILDQRIAAKGYSLYHEKLLLRKETRLFTLHDYLIIPIQRVARYGLLLADLQKHTEPNHPDAEDIRIARHIIHSLASAMNLVQK